MFLISYSLEPKIEIRLKYFLGKKSQNAPIVKESVCPPILILAWGPFNNYMDKMRGGGGQKMSCFCPRSGYKNCPRRRGCQKMAKFCPRSC